MSDLIKKLLMREKFNEITVPHFNEYDENFLSNIKDHWETFQEGWEAAIEYVKQSGNNYSDIVSDGGMDPR